MKYLILCILPLLYFTSCWPTSVSVIDKGGKPEEWKTFSLQTLENKAPNAPLNYSVSLSESIKDGIQNNTNLLLNSETGKGEVYIEGSINNYSIMPVAMQDGDNAAKNRLTVGAQFTFYISAPKEEQMTLNVSRFVDYESGTDLTTVENTLLDEISKQIVQDVINKLLSNW